MVLIHGSHFFRVLSSKMSSVCHSCANEIVESHVMCQGFCSAVFHATCTGISADAFEEVMKNHQVFWLCRSCTSLMKDNRFRNSVRSAHEIGQELALNSHSDIMQSLKSEILTELKNEIKTNFATLINSSSLTPKSTRRGGFNPLITNRRRLFNVANDKNSVPNRNPPLLSGAGSTPSPSMEIATVPAAQPRFWLYLSRIARDVSVEQMDAYAKKRLGTDDIQVTRLVAKGRDISSMSFISFKIGMNTDMKSKALSTSTWPKGVVFREFSDNRSAENFWRPTIPPAGNDHLKTPTETDEVSME